MNKRKKIAIRLRDHRKLQFKVENLRLQNERFEMASCKSEDYMAQKQNLMQQIRKMEIDILEVSNAMDSLDKISATVIKLYYFDNCRIEDIATRVDYCREWVCRIKSKAMSQLEEMINDNPLE